MSPKSHLQISEIRLKGLAECVAAQWCANKNQGCSASIHRRAPRLTPTALNHRQKSCNNMTLLRLTDELTMRANSLIVHRDVSISPMRLGDDLFNVIRVHHEKIVSRTQSYRSLFRSGNLETTAGEKTTLLCR